ncbi:helix-turn-helix domain-containing protein [Demequina sp. NBRC 110051]|uniref:winged helix-turn-helix transcriptional regulator n=1 Tax=Demequina sp. NBRC 110051 TaxID=1570340 RepID=UPI000A01722E|nr:helix-turn-helix domain-containing protein [Demequina sp. NBRC 110051]
MSLDSAPDQALVADVFARDCTSRSTFEDVADKWPSLILIALGEGTQRFGQLRARVSGVSERMLAQSLRTLERDGMITRTAYAESPPRVDYALTALGAQVAVRLRDLADLLEGAVPQIEEARERYGS